MRNETVLDLCSYMYVLAHDVPVCQCDTVQRYYIFKVLSALKTGRSLN